MIELLTSDPAIVLAAAVGLAATTVSILRDARAQRALVTGQPALTVVETHDSDGMELAA